MHYIRLLRPPAATPPWYNASNLEPYEQYTCTLSLVLAITTDLGDALLAPAQPVALVAELTNEYDYGTAELTEEEDRRTKKYKDVYPLRRGVRGAATVLPMTPSRLRSEKGHKNGKGGKGKTKSDGGSGRGVDAVGVCWQAGLQVLKIDLAFDADAAYSFFSVDEGANRHKSRVRLRIAPADSALAVEHVQHFAGMQAQALGDVRIVPLWLDRPLAGPPVAGGNGFRHRLEFPRVSLRRLQTGPGARDFVEVEEDLDESIARHVWDAGLAAVAFVAAAAAACGGRQGSNNGNAVADALRPILLLSPPPPPEEEEDAVTVVVGAPPPPPPPLRVLELGSGVGILGIGLAETIPRQTGRHVAVLLTDLPDAEERLLGSIARAEAAQRAARGPIRIESLASPASPASPAADVVEVDAPDITSTTVYETLDWEDGAAGRFGPRATVAPPKPGKGCNPRRPWDLIVLSDCTYNADRLPALVATVAALHAAARRVAPAFVSHVLVFRKPRHADEEVLFGLLAAHGWAEVARATVPLPGGGGDGPGGAVEVYLYRCG